MSYSEYHDKTLMSKPTSALQPDEKALRDVLLQQEIDHLNKKYPRDFVRDLSITMAKDLLAQERTTEEEHLLD